MEAEVTLELTKREHYCVRTDVLPIVCPICQFTVHDGNAIAFTAVCRHVMDEHGLTCTLSRGEGELKSGYRHAVADFR